MQAQQAINTSLGRTTMSTFLFLALSSAFLLGMVAGALTRRIAN
jgi:hypothetical protein